MNQETATKIVARLRALRDMQDRNGLAWLTLEWAAIDISIQYNVRAAELWPEVIRFPVHRNGTYQFTIIMSKLFSAVQRDLVTYQCQCGWELTLPVNYNENRLGERFKEHVDEAHKG